MILAPEFLEYLINQLRKIFAKHSFVFFDKEGYYQVILILAVYSLFFICPDCLALQTSKAFFFVKKCI